MRILTLIEELDRLFDVHGNVLVALEESTGFTVTDVWVGADQNGDVVVVVD